MTFTTCHQQLLEKCASAESGGKPRSRAFTIPASCEKAFADTKIQPGLSLVPNVTRFPHKGMSKRLFDADSVVSMASEV